MIAASHARRLKPVLDALLDPRAMAARVPFDPVRFPRRYLRPGDAEIVALLSACLAYGRAELFGARLETLFGRMGPHPGELARAFDPERDRALFEGIAYRLNVPADLAALMSAAGRVQREEGTLGAAFAAAFSREGNLRSALSAFSSRLRAAVDPRVERALGALRAFDHLLPDPARGGACKRLLLFVRWMVRGGRSDPVDLGLWSKVPACVLVVPLDTHVARVALCLGLTRRRDLSWATAEDVTASLRCLDPLDPVRYDFALCHHGMSGACGARTRRAACSQCSLAAAFRGGARPAAPSRRL